MMERNEPITPPWSLDLEQSVLGSLMLLQSDDQRFQFCIDNLESSDFYRPDHRLIFSAIVTLAAEKHPHDWLTISEQAKRLELSDQSGIGGGHLSSYLGTMAKDTPSAANVVSYAKSVRNASTLRRSMLMLDELRAAASVPDFSDEHVDAVIERITSFAFDLEQGRAAKAESMKSLKPAIKALLDGIQTAISDPNASDIPGISTGYPGLDQRFGGLEPGKFYLVAATPAMGKTTLAMNIAENVAIACPDKMVNIFSVEMTIAELAEKFVASAGRANFNHIRSPKLVSDADWPRIAQGVSKLSKTNLYIDDDGRMTPGKVRRQLRATMHKTGKLPALVVVDFIQIMQGDKENYQNENKEVGEISRELKAIAKEFNVPVIGISQLNREVANRTNHIPVMKDLRGSGELEANANVIIFIHRPSAVAIAEGREDELSESDKREAMIIVGKARSGRPGTERLAFFGEHQRFDEFSPEVDAPGGAW